LRFYSSSQVACNRVQPRKVTIEKKDEINEYKRKKKYKKKEKTKRRAYQCPPPFIMEYPSANRAYTGCLYYCPTSSISAIFRPKTIHVHNTRISYVNKSVSFAGFSGFVCIINNQILRRHAAILVCPVQGKQCGHLKFSENVCTKNY
jgi:hypothetical protein